MVPIIQVALSGHLTTESLRASLAAAASELPEEGTATLLIDCRLMSGYDRDARELFVKWNAEVKGRVHGVAVVTDNALYRMVVGAMSLASAQSMKAFEDHHEATAWAKGISAS